jgi:hypothetical protein
MGEDKVDRDSENSIVLGKNEITKLKRNSMLLMEPGVPTG